MSKLCSWALCMYHHSQHTRTGQTVKARSKIRIRFHQITEFNSDLETDDLQQLHSDVESITEYVQWSDEDQSRIVVAYACLRMMNRQLSCKTSSSHPMAARWTHYMLLPVRWLGGACAIFEIVKSVPNSWPSSDSISYFIAIPTIVISMFSVITWEMVRILRLIASLTNVSSREPRSLWIYVKSFSSSGWWGTGPKGVGLDRNFRNILFSSSSARAVIISRNSLNLVYSLDFQSNSIRLSVRRWFDKMSMSMV